MENAQQTTPQNGNGKRKRMMLTVGAVFAGAGIAYGAWWTTSGQYREATDDAYVAGNIVQVMPQTAGTVTAIHADDTQMVIQGQPLITLDPTDAAVGLAQARAELADTVRQVRALFGNAEQARATVALRRTELARTQADLKRRESLAADQTVSAEEVGHARDAVASAEAALKVAEEQVATLEAQVADTTIEQHPSVERAKAKLVNAYLTQVRGGMPAPVSGYVAKRAVQLGQRVQPGAPLMSIVPLDQLWVDANFKEGQLGHIRIGQPVTLKADLYGSKVEYHGKVAGLAAGTGSAFALLPPQNASGNWIKVVQRVPVRVVLDAAEIRKNPLRIGLSMDVEIDTHRRDGAVLAQAPAAQTVYQTRVFDEQARAADKLIADIVRANAGHTVKKHG